MRKFLIGLVGAICLTFLSGCGSYHVERKFGDFYHTTKMIWKEPYREDPYPFMYFGRAVGVFEWHLAWVPPFELLAFEPLGWSIHQVERAVVAPVWDTLMLPVDISVNSYKWVDSKITERSKAKEAERLAEKRKAEEARKLEEKRRAEEAAKLEEARKAEESAKRETVCKADGAVRADKKSVGRSVKAVGPAMKLETLVEQFDRSKHAGAAAVKRGDEELLGCWGCKCGFGIGLQENGIAYVIGSIGAFDARWGMTEDGVICVMMPYERFVARKICAQYDAVANRLVNVRYSWVNLATCTEETGGEGRTSDMSRLGEKATGDMQAAIQQLEEQKKLVQAEIAARSEKDARKRTAGEALKPEEFAFSDERGVRELVECIKSRGVVRLWCGDEEAAEISIYKQGDLGASVFLGEHLYGDETMTTPQDDIPLYGEKLERLPDGAKLISWGLDARLVRRFMEEMRGIVAESSPLIYSCPKPCYSIVMSYANFKFKPGVSEAELVESVVKFLRASGSGELMVSKWTPPSRQNGK